MSSPKKKMKELSTYYQDPRLIYRESDIVVNSPDRALAAVFFNILEIRMSWYVGILSFVNVESDKVLFDLAEHERGASVGPLEPYSWSGKENDFYCCGSLPADSKAKIPKSIYGAFWFRPKEKRVCFIPLSCAFYFEPSWRGEDLVLRRKGGEGDTTCEAWKALVLPCREMKFYRWEAVQKDVEAAVQRGKFGSQSGFADPAKNTKYGKGAYWVERYVVE